MKVVINEEFYCQTKRNGEPWRESKRERDCNEFQRERGRQTVNNLR